MFQGVSNMFPLFLFELWGHKDNFSRHSKPFFFLLVRLKNKQLVFGSELSVNVVLKIMPFLLFGPNNFYRACNVTDRKYPPDGLRCQKLHKDWKTCAVPKPNVINPRYFCSRTPTNCC